jgi:hypothetical protein
MYYKKYISIALLSITGSITGGIIGGLASTYIFRYNSATKNTARWYIGNFSTVFGIIVGSIVMPYKCIGFIHRK